MADDRLGLAGDKLFRHLRQSLRHAWFFYIKRQPNHNEENQEQQNRDQLHGEHASDGRSRVKRRQADPIQQSRHRTRQQLVQNVGKEVLKGHRSYFLSRSFKLWFIPTAVRRFSCIIPSAPPGGWIPPTGPPEIQLAQPAMHKLSHANCLD